MEKFLLSLAIFPPIEYFSLLVYGDEVTIEAHENYNKQSYRNRYYIYGPNGRQALNIPVTKLGKQKIKTSFAGIDNKDKWQLNHWRSIETAYNASPFFLYYRDAIEPLFNKEYNDLWSFGTETINTCLKLLKLPVDYKISSEYCEKDDQIDFRESIHPKKLNFTNASLAEQASYMQVFEEKHGFIPNLSILDLLFNLGPEALKYLEAVYIKINK